MNDALMLGSEAEKNFLMKMLDKEGGKALEINLKFLVAATIS